jgi:hypothetical protein
MEEKELIVLEKNHIKLVQNLKDSLLIGQSGFLRAGAILSEIKEKETYKAEDSAHEWSFNDFINRPDLPFPGRTPQSRRRTADALIRVYNIFKKKFSYKTNILAPIGWTKLDLISRAVELLPVNAHKQADEWLDKAKTLSMTDLAMELKEDGKEIGHGLLCTHTDAYWISYCPKCGARSKQDLRTKKK